MQNSQDCLEFIHGTARVYTFLVFEFSKTSVPEFNANLKGLCTSQLLVGPSWFTQEFRVQIFWNIWLRFWFQSYPCLYIICTPRRQRQLSMGFFVCLCCVLQQSLIHVTQPGLELTFFPVLVSQLCATSRQLESAPQDPHGKRRELTPSSYPLPPRYILWNVRPQTQTQKKSK